MTKEEQAVNRSAMRRWALSVAPWPESPRAVRARVEAMRRARAAFDRACKRLNEKREKLNDE